MDDKSLPKITNFSHFLTEHQKQQLGCQSREESTLVEKYRFYQALYSQKSLVFLVQKSEEDNKTLSSFAEEFLRSQGKTMEKSPYSKEFFLQSLRESFQAKSSWQGEEETGYRELKKENQELLEKGSFHLGAYDWRNLQACTKYFYFSKVLQEPFRTEALSFGISPKQLGIICHRFLEKIGKTQWKIFLKEKHFVISNDTLVEYLEEEFQREALRIPSFLKNYLEKIVYPRIIKNTKNFLHTLEKKYHQENISRFQGEKGIQREGIYFGEDFTVSFQGRADLIIETDQRKEIIDYKTGKTIDDQLDFYAFLLYGEDKNVEGRYFNLWDGIFLPPRKKKTLASLFSKNILRTSREMNSTIFRKKNLSVSIALIKKFVGERRKYYEKTCPKSKCGNRKNLSFVFGISTFSLSGNSLFRNFCHDLYQKGNGRNSRTDFGVFCRNFISFGERKRISGTFAGIGFDSFFERRSSESCL
ncbi:hypothetical protein C095_03640 [Fusobacterium necrophorum subsp. funduliforme B35]|uniref:PD-(D/E)XK endonuclease-like domain-containing protein n=1 Tax=Fusobacterium necrophorum subsp. funduliforme B35 TaxID=1226633 RepID=A0A0B4E8T7_9FUSO|nr:hypothetical protein C095_03640 [Fusobacterium necrophorum subsp. funduliforme B35]